LPAIGFELEAPGEVEVTPVAETATVVRCCERDGDKTVGELEVELFTAALIIDRDGILAEKADRLTEDSGGRAHPAVAVELPGVRGFRASAERGRDVELPYLYVLAIAGSDVGNGGVLITIRSAQPTWPAADSILRTLRLLDRRGAVQPANDGELALPLVGRPEPDD
jgi:hypothetical protein